MVKNKTRKTKRKKPSSRRPAKTGAGISSRVSATHAHYLSKYSNDLIILLDDKFHFLEVNERVVDVYKYGLRELIGMHASRLRAPEARDDFASQIKRAQLTGKALYETVHQRKDGTKFPVEISLHAFRVGAKKYFQAVIRDISERRESEKALKENERKYRELVQHANSIILRWDSSGRINFLNEFGQRFFGFSEKEIIGRHVVGTIVPTSDSMGHDLAPLMDKICEDPEAFEQNINENMRRNGQRVWIAWTNKILQDKDGKVLEILSVGTDITETKKAQEAVRELNENLEKRVRERTAELAIAKERAEAADRIKSAFLATMSHELRTPLNSIIGFTGIILQGMAGPLNPEQNKQLEMVRNSSRHLLALINDVLDISKIEAGQLEVKKEPFDLRASLDKVIGIVRPLAEKKSLALELKTGREIGMLDSDSRRVEQILLNLLNNAIKFTQKGKVELEAGIFQENGRNYLRLCVSDTGIGIKPEDLGKLFEPFRQIDSGLTRQYEGTGLGLVICRKLAQLLGGDVGVQSQWEQGSAFTLTLPL